jgi:predicted negative regulator of RcsB-dependent stress response
MAEMRTEEEQIQAIKDWWKENGSSLLIGIGAALAIIFGWQAWQNYQTEQHTAAANEFVALLSAHSGQDGETDTERTETVAFVAQKLRDNYSSSAYAIYGNLILAQQQLAGDDAPAAIESLKWAQEKVGENKALSLIVRNRLARAQFSAERYDDALATISNVSNADSFDAIFFRTQRRHSACQRR